MLRYSLCAAALIGYAAAASADELDKEFSLKPAPATVSTTPGGSELDKESPQAAHHWRGGWGYGYYPGYYAYGRGFGYVPAAYSVGFYRPYYGGFYGYPTFGYSPGFYGASYYTTGFYGGFGYRSFYNYGGFGPGYWW